MSMQQQRGGTFIGIVIGLLLGLGIALAVAVYVTKVPIPFLFKDKDKDKDKGQARGPEQDEAEARKNKDWEPNTPLSGKGAARAPQAPTGAVGSAPGPGPDPAPTPTPAPAPTATASAAKPAVSTDPLGDLVRARATANAPVVNVNASPAEPFTYFVQAGAYRTPEEAETQRARLSLVGVEARVTEREQSGRNIYRVRVGPFDKKDDADKTKDKLEASGLETALVRVQR